jgi:hypothetical protein
MNCAPRVGLQFTLGYDRALVLELFESLLTPKCPSDHIWSTQNFGSFVCG